MHFNIRDAKSGQGCNVPTAHSSDLENSFAHQHAMLLRKYGLAFSQAVIPIVNNISKALPRGDVHSTHQQEKNFGSFCTY